MALLTVEGVYKDGKIELIESPAGVVEAARVLVTFLPANGSVEEGQSAETRPRESREEVLKRVFARMDQGVNLGGPPYPKRDELYDRLKRFK